MANKLKSLNTQLRENYPAGYALDATHLPHVTLLQRFVRAKDFDWKARVVEFVSPSM